MSCHKTIQKQQNKYINSNFILNQFRMYFPKWNIKKLLLNTFLQEIWKIFAYATIKKKN